MGFPLFFRQERPGFAWSFLLTEPAKSRFSLFDAYLRPLITAAMRANTKSSVSDIALTTGSG
jgi:hypothetical protein